WPLARMVDALFGPHRVPVGILTFCSPIADATSSMPIPRLASDVGSSCTRTAYFWAPYTCTCAIPGTIEMRWARYVSPYSSRSDSGIVFEVSAKYRIGWSAGFTLRYDGGRMPSGRLRRV